MVCDTDMPNFLAASCWRVEVVKGAAGVLRPGLVLISIILNDASLHKDKKA